MNGPGATIIYAADDAKCGLCMQPAPATIYRGQRGEPICEVCFLIRLEEMEKAELRDLLGGIEL